MAEQPPTNGRYRKFYYSNEISLGNLLSIIVMLSTVLYIFGELRGDVRVLAEKVSTNSTRITAVEEFQSNRTIYGNIK